MPNFVTGAPVPPSHLGQANTHFVKNITKPFAKAARFIVKKMNLSQVKPNPAGVQFKKATLSKAAKKLLNEAQASSFNPPRSRTPQPHLRTHTLTESDGSISSERTQKASNKFNGARYLKERALNPENSWVSTPRTDSYDQKQKRANRDFVLAAQEGYHQAINNLLAINEIDFSQVAGQALAQAVIHNHEQVFDTIVCEPKLTTVKNLDTVVDLIIQHERYDMLEALASQRVGVEALVAASFRVMANQAESGAELNTDRKFHFLYAAIGCNVKNLSSFTEELYRYALMQGSESELNTFVNVVPSYLKMKLPLSDELMLKAVEHGRQGALKALLDKNKLIIDKHIAQKALLLASDKEDTQMIDTLLADKKIVNACYTDEFINSTIVEGRGNLCVKLIRRIRPLKIAPTDYNFIHKCIRYIETALENGHQELMPLILRLSGYVPGKDPHLDGGIVYSRMMNKKFQATLLEFLLKDSRFDPSVFNNYALFEANALKNQYLISTLLTDIRVHEQFFGRDVENHLLTLKSLIYDLSWQPKFTFKELVAAINGRIESYPLDRRFSNDLLPNVKSAIEVRHENAVKEAEKLAKVFLKKGFDALFIRDKVTQIYGHDMFALQSKQEQSQNIMALIQAWEIESK